MHRTGLCDFCVPTQATKIAETGGGSSIDTKHALQHPFSSDKVIFLKLKG